MAEGTPLAPQESSEPVNSTSVSEHTETKFSYLIPASSGMRDVRELLNPVHTLSPVEAQLISAVKAPTLTEEEQRTIWEPFKEKGIITDDETGSADISEEALEVLLKLSTKKRNAVLTKAYALYFLNKTAKATTKENS